MKKITLKQKEIEVSKVVSKESIVREELIERGNLKHVMEDETLFKAFEDNNVLTKDNSQVLHDNARQTESFYKDIEVRAEDKMQALEDNAMLINENYEVALEDDGLVHDENSNPSGKKTTRGPIKMKGLSSDAMRRIEVEFNVMAELVGAGSVILSSYLGSLVREHVPFTLSDWRQLDDDIKIVLWEFIQARFKLNEEWQKVLIFQQMEGIWRASKSRLIIQIGKAKTKEEILQLKPDNINNMKEWRDFVKLKTSSTFKKKQSADPPSVSRVQVWIKSRTRKNDEQAKDKKINECQNTILELTKTISMLVNNHGKESRIDEGTSGMGISEKIHEKCNLLDCNGIDDIVAEGRVLSNYPNEFVHKIPLGPNGMKILIEFPRIMDAFLWRTAATMTCVGEAEDMIVAWSTNGITLHTIEHEKEDNVNGSEDSKCKLFDWMGSEELVDEGQICYSDPKHLVNGISLGPSAMLVSIDNPKKMKTFFMEANS